MSVAHLQHLSRSALPMTGRSDEIEEDVHTVVPEPWVTLDPGLLGQDIVVLPLKISNNFTEAAVVSV